MYLLGINRYAHDSSAALLRDGKLVFAAAEERFSRIKKDRGFPRLAIQAALDHEGIRMSDVEAIGFGWNRPGASPLYTLRAAVTGRIRPSAQYVFGSLSGGLRDVYQGSGVRELRWAFGPIDDSRIYFVDHHAAHAWSAFAYSGFEESLVIVMDGRGSRQATTVYHASGQELKPLRVFDWPNSLGLFYESFTDLLGFERHSDEWKVMGLAAYGTPTYALDKWIRVTPGGYKVNGKLLAGRNPADYSALEVDFGPRREPERHISDDDRNLAASVQRALEDAVFSVAREGVRLTGCRKLCLAGGVAMNSKANGRLLASGMFEDIFVQPAATDDGCAAGAALGVLRALGHEFPRGRLQDVYLGPEFSDEEIGQTLSMYKLCGRYDPEIEVTVARQLSQGKIVGWFQGRMEFGPRALGGRSILADPRLPEMKDRVNECVKFREGWRPFAPSCMEEHAAEYFEKCESAPFMILTFAVKREKREIIPAVTHADNTARVQTVSRDTNPRYWKVIDEFRKITGVPVVMNTSFNLRGEPIVCTPKDAIRTFSSSGLDTLAIGNFILEKQTWLSEGRQPHAEQVGSLSVR